jgi:hypothetical protein
MRRAARAWVEGVAGALLLAGCGGPKAYVRPGLLEHPPRRVAVLPFAITYAYDLADGQPLPPSHAVGRDVLRKTFYYAFTPYGYEDMKLEEVDAKLAAAFGPIDAGAWRQAQPQALGAALGADALIYGEIGRLMHFTTPLYTETSLAASLRMVEASSGEVLWRKQAAAAERGGALMKKGQVVDFLKDQARSFNPSVKFLRISDAAVRQLLRDFPNPAVAEPDAGADGWGRELSSGAARLAILPLGAKRKGWDKQAAALRMQLMAGLQGSPFEVLELQRVDAALQARGWATGGPVPADLPLPELAHALGADVMLRGQVTNWGRTYMVVESWVKAGLALELVDGESGEVIWSAEKHNRRHAGILKGPTGYKSVATAPITGLKASHLERVATHLVRMMAEELIASPAVRAYLSERRKTAQAPGGQT